MKTLTIKLEHCYGIRTLDAKLDFATAKAIAIYAPNGSMKTSLAQTFQDIASGTDSKDRIFPARVCTRVVRDENDADLPKDSVLVSRLAHCGFATSSGLTGLSSQADRKSVV